MYAWGNCPEAITDSLFPLPSVLELQAPARDAFALIQNEGTSLIWEHRMPVGDKLIIKMYRKRNACDTFRSRITRYRVQREHQFLSHLHHCSIPCSTPLGWLSSTDPINGHYELLITRRVESAETLEQLLAMRTSVPLEEEFFFSLIDTIRDLHRCGVHHGALIPRNVLVTFDRTGMPKFHFIDMASSFHFKQDLAGTRMAAFDLMELLKHTPPALDHGALLEHYGLSAEASQRLLKQLRAYHPTKHTRNRLRGEFMLRSWSNRVIGRNTAARPPGAWASSASRRLEICA